MRGKSSITPSRSPGPFRALLLSSAPRDAAHPARSAARRPAAAAGLQVSAASPERAHIEAVYKSHCGSCHTPVASGSEPSDRLEAELERHYKRTRLTEAEWAGLDAFLTGP